MCFAYAIIKISGLDTRLDLIQISKGRFFALGIGRILSNISPGASFNLFQASINSARANRSGCPAKESQPAGVGAGGAAATDSAAASQCEAARQAALISILPQRHVRDLASATARSC